MLADGFKNRYTTIPFAIYRGYDERGGALFSHYHKEAELIAITEGRIDFYIGSDCYRLERGDVLIIPPYSVHRSLVYPGTSHDCICFDLSILWDKELCHELESGTLTVKTSLSGGVAHALISYNCIKAAIAAYEHKHSGWEMEVIGQLSVMFGRLMAESFFVKTAKIDQEQLFVKDVMAYLNKHFAEQITSATVSTELHLNNSYFCRIFKKSFGCTFSEYLTEYRIEQAKLLLNTSDLSISDIALNCGFNGFSYFSKAFRLTVGVSPSEYRKRKSEIR